MSQTLRTLMDAAFRPNPPIGRLELSLQWMDADSRDCNSHYLLHLFERSKVLPDIVHVRKLAAVLFILLLRCRLFVGLPVIRLAQVVQLVEHRHGELENLAGARQLCRGDEIAVVLLITVDTEVLVAQKNLPLALVNGCQAPVTVTLSPSSLTSLVLNTT